MNKFSKNEPEPSNWQEQLELLNGFTLELQSLAQEMVLLLREHNESKWRNVESDSW